MSQPSIDFPAESISLVKRVTCPHCWHVFRPDEVLWVAEHEELLGDAILKDEPLRFLPTRFNTEGQALDARGLACHTLACPGCHLVIPRVLLEHDVTFLSIIGSAGSGKSNFLATMTWEMRQRLARRFALIFSDGDKESNWILNRYEELLFLPEDPEQPIVLEKTRTQGDLYRSVVINRQETQLPKPFLFQLHPSADHPRHALKSRLARTICCYDNAGEHYAVGQDSAMTPATRHLSRAKILMFLLDPTQDPRFRQRCKSVSQDPQILAPLQTIRQENILTEATQRIRRHSGLSAYQKYDRPLLILVAKSDIWGPLIPDEDIIEDPYVTHPGQLATVDCSRIERISQKLRSLLLEISPEIVTVAEDFTQQVLFIPVSSLGTSPERHPNREGLLIRPSQIKPRWVTVPLLYSYARWATGMVEAQ